MFAYPTADVAIPQIQILVGMLLGRTPADIPTAANSGWVTQGYLQDLAIGMPEPDDSVPAMASAETSSSFMALADTDSLEADREAVALLTKLADIDPAAPQAAGLLDGLGGRAILTLLLPVIQKWLVNWLQQGGLQELISKVGQPAE